MRVSDRIRWLMLALFVAVIASTARSDNPPNEADKKKQIEELEKKIAELEKKREELKSAGNGASKPAITAALPYGGIPTGAGEKFSWRCIGPANMGGRITAIAVYNADPTTYFIATASGGLLKTVNNGTSFEHQFDKESTVSIGDVAVCQSDPNLVWVGTGEANPRNSVSYGDGVYKSTNGGKSWTNMGLKKSFQIGKILIHPKDKDIVYVGALGRLYGPNEERGLFKTTDGGKTWEKVLYVDDKTGVIDAVMDPTDPDTIIAAMWERKRDEFDGFFGEPPVPDSYGPIVTHGKGGGLYKTTDGGKTWKKLTDPELKNGLPTVKTGRIGLDYSWKTKGLIYAIIDTEKVGTGDPIRQVYMGIVGETHDTDKGAKLNEITEGSPASKAGLKPGDIITKADELTIKTYDELLDFIRGTKADQKVKLTILRDGKEEIITVTMANRPEQTGGFPGRGGAGGRGGAQSQAPSRPTAGFRFGGEGKAVIASVTAGSGAEKAGLKEGDEIVAVDGKEVKSAAEYIQAVGNDRKAGDKLKITYIRGGEKHDTEVTLSAPAAAETQVLMPGLAPDMASRGEGEVKVALVEKGSDAEKAGVKVGDIILEVEGRPVSSFFTMITAMRTSPREDNPRKAGDKVKVKIKQAEKTLDLELTLVMMNVPGMRGGGPMRGANAARPYQMGLGGQQPNMQDLQGKEGYNTGGVYVSKDNGDTWTRVNSLNARPMYFSVIRVDPSDDNTVYVLCDTPTPLYRSTNGGKRFEIVRTAGGVHADAHALWINPKNSRHLIIGCDGGFYVSYDKGAKWDHLNTLALGQFYHVAADNRRPYRVYGGLQDNGSWGGPSQSLRSYGPVNEDWVFINGGDGFVCRVDPTDPDLIYAESQGGMMNRRNLRTGERGFIRPAQREGEPAHRFNWNTPFILSHHNPSIFYCGSEYVWKSIAKGANLKKISPELTRTKKGSLTAISESPVNADVLWAGSDDGFVWVTRDGGANWTNVTEAIKSVGLPDFRWVATLEASRERDARCYVCFDAHRSDDDRPYIFVTDDFGKTWKNITSNLPVFGSTRCLREDMVNRDLLYCGTEFGAFVSANRGESWVKLGNDLPTVAVHELAQTTSAPELIAATHGRSIWIVNIAALRQIKPNTLRDAVTLFAPPTAVRWRTSGGAESPYSSTDRKFVGRNADRGVTLDYVLTKPAKELTLKILDVNGKNVRSFNRAEKSVGFHRVSWDLSRGASAAEGPGGRGGRGQGGGGGFVAPGTYRVVLTVDGTEYSQPITVELDPNAPKDLVIIEEDDEQIEPVNPLKPKKVAPNIDD